MVKLKQSDTVFVKRSQVNFAAYNPRKRDENIVNKLKANFRKVGFMGGIQWNATTGNLIGGHKRTEALDLINGYDGTPEKDYEIKVERIELDEKTEKEQNIFLNNRRAQGETDYELLAEMMNDIDINNAAIEDYDIEIMQSLVPDFQMGNNESIVEEISKRSEKSHEEKKSDMKDLKNKIKSNIGDNQQASYFIVTFPDYDEKAEYLESIGISGDSIYITHKEYLKRISEE